MPDSESGRVTRARTRPGHFRTKQLIQPATRVSLGVLVLCPQPRIHRSRIGTFLFFSENLPRWWDPVEVIRALPGHGNASVGSEQRFLGTRELLRKKIKAFPRHGAAR